MSGRALVYLTDFFGTDGDAEVRKSTLRTGYRELIGSAFGALKLVSVDRVLGRYSATREFVTITEVYGAVVAYRLARI